VIIKVVFFLERRAVTDSDTRQKFHAAAHIDFRFALGETAGKKAEMNLI